MISPSDLAKRKDYIGHLLETNGVVPERREFIMSLVEDLIERVQVQGYHDGKAAAYVGMRTVCEAHLDVIRKLHEKYANPQEKGERG